MLHGLHTKDAVEQLTSEGARFLYRGILPPLCQKTLSVSVMFGAYHEYRRRVEVLRPKWTVRQKQAAAAVLAGLTEAVLTPFERVQMLLQDKKYHQTYRNTFHAFAELRRFGLCEYYRGLTPILIRNSLSNAMFFTLRDEIGTRLPPTRTTLGKLLADFCCGAVVGAFISTVFYPVNIFKTHMQCSVGGPFVNLWTTASIVFNERQRSVSRIFYGVHVNYTRALISWGIINASYELFKSLLDH